MCCFPLLPQSHIHPISIHIPVFLAAYSWVAGTPARWIGIHLTRLMTRSVQGNSSQAVEHQSATGRGNCSLSIHCKKSKCHLWGVISYIYIYYTIIYYYIQYIFYRHPKWCWKPLQPRLPRHAMTCNHVAVSTARNQDTTWSVADLQHSGRLDGKVRTFSI